MKKDFIFKGNMRGADIDGESYILYFGEKVNLNPENPKVALMIKHQELQEIKEKVVTIPTELDKECSTVNKTAFVPGQDGSDKTEPVSLPKENNKKANTTNNTEDKK